MRYVLFCMLAGLPFTTQALELPTTPSCSDGAVIQLHAQASREVTADTVRMQLEYEHDGTDPRQLSDQASRTIAAALKKAEAYPGVKAFSDGFSVSPRHDNNGTAVGWQVRAALMLGSKDFDAVSKLAGALSGSGLAVGSLSTYLAPETRRSVEDSLVPEAVKAFDHDAQTTAQAFGASHSQLCSATVSRQGGGAPRPVAYGAMMKSAAATVPISPQTTQVTVTVSGKVLIRK
jgi:predicted secreted protein